jgi:hypothetical protein
LSTTNKRKNKTHIRKEEIKPCILADDMIFHTENLKEKPNPLKQISKQKTNERINPLRTNSTAAKQSCTIYILINNTQECLFFHIFNNILISGFSFS